MHDLHCHLLPALDDGPTTLEDSLAMARAAAADGIRRAVVTPHADRVAQAGGPDQIQRRLQALQAELDRGGIPLTLLPGAEHKLRPDLVRDLREGTATRLNGSRYLLVELDFVTFPPYTEDIIFQIRLHGATPVLAHPERQEVLQRSMGRLKSLIAQGVVVQLTAGSLEGAFGGQAKRAAQTMLREGLVHILATDAHGPHGPRPQIMSRGLSVAEKIVGARGVDMLVRENPVAILEDRNVSPLEPPASRSLWPAWMRR